VLSCGFGHFLYSAFRSNTFGVLSLVFFFALTDLFDGAAPLCLRCPAPYGSYPCWAKSRGTLYAGQHASAIWHDPGDIKSKDLLKRSRGEASSAAAVKVPEGR